MEPKQNLDNLYLKKFNYDVWFENEESTHTTRKKDSERLDRCDKIFLTSQT